MNYFTSDTHFMHENILKYCPGRKWATKEEMTECLIAAWNSQVKPDDVVYHLGDFCMGGKQNLALRKRLMGKIILIKGNHDFKTKKNEDSTQFLLDHGFDEVHPNLKLELDGLKLWLSHIPLGIADPFGGDRNEHSFPGEILKSPPADYIYDYYICGHVHDKWARQGKTINAGLDVSNYRLLTLPELLKRDPCPTSEK